MNSYLVNYQIIYIIITMKQENLNWAKELPFAITVCDKEGIITYMNDAASKVFQKSGGSDLVGKNLLECHPEPAKSKLKEMLKTGSTNAYTIEKNGMKKMIYQSPCYEDGQFNGLIEISFQIPQELPHFVRK